MNQGAIGYPQNRRVGAPGTVLTSDPAQPDGVAWAASGVPNRIRTGASYYHSAPGFGQTAANSSAVSRLHTCPWPVDRPCFIDRIGLYVTVAVAASTVRLGIYADDGTGIPSALLLDAGTVDSSTTGFKELTVLSPLASGVYWVAAAQQGGASPISWIVASGDAQFAPMGLKVNSSTGAVIAQYVHNGYYQAGVTGSLPNPMVPAFNDLTTRAPRVVMRVI